MASSWRRRWAILDPMPMTQRAGPSSELLSPSSSRLPHCGSARPELGRRPDSTRPADWPTSAERCERAGSPAEVENGQSTVDRVASRPPVVWGARKMERRTGQRAQKVNGEGARGGVDDGTVCRVVRVRMWMEKKGGSCRRCRGEYKVREDWGRWGRENVRSKGREREKRVESSVPPRPGQG